MSKKDDREVINIYPGHIEVKFNATDFSFEFAILGWRGKSFDGKRVRVVLKFDFWWIKYIKSRLNFIVEKAQKKVDEASE